MFLVIVTHAGPSLGPIGGYETSSGICAAAIICDPIFFALSGYFAIRPLKRTLKGYYLNKVITIIVPLFIYSIVLYLYKVWSGGNTVSLGNYIVFFESLLSSSWWFIPALIPCLIAAPFIAKGFEALSNKQLAILGCILMVLFASGAALNLLKWVFAKYEVKSLEGLCDIALYLFPPSILTRIPQYFEFFILGGIYRRVAPILTKRAENWLVFSGLGCWVIDIVFSINGIPQTDPNLLWIFITIAAMILCERLMIESQTAKRAISWAAMRSYSIYLLNREALSLSGLLFYNFAIFGNVATMQASMRIAIWILMVLVAYGIALAIASLLDIVLLKPIQKLLSRLAEKEIC